MFFIKNNSSNYLLIKKNQIFCTKKHIFLKTPKVYFPVNHVDDCKIKDFELLGFSILN